METNKQWFETWFDSPYYHLLYQNRNEAEAQTFIDHLLDFLAPPSNATILDLACGKGRHAKYIAENEQQFQVTGVDLSPNSIAHAQTFAHERLDFQVHDMRALFKANYFDYIFNFFTSFGYFENTDDNQKTIAAVYEGLVKEGTFVIDFLNTPKAIKNLVPYEKKVIQGVHFDIYKKVENGFITKEIKVQDADKQLLFREKVQALQLEDIKTYLEQSQFEIKQVWGSYLLEPYDINSSDRLIIVAQK